MSRKARLDNPERKGRLPNGEPSTGAAGREDRAGAEGRVGANDTAGAEGTAGKADGTKCAKSAAPIYIYKYTQLD